MVRDSLLQLTSTVSNVLKHKQNPFAWRKATSRLPSAAFLSKNGRGRSSLSSTVSRHREQSKPGKSVTTEGLYRIISISLGKR